MARGYYGKPQRGVRNFTILNESNLNQREQILNLTLTDEEKTLLGWGSPKKLSREQEIKNHAKRVLSQALIKIQEKNELI